MPQSRGMPGLAGQSSLALASGGIGAENLAVSFATADKIPSRSPRRGWRNDCPILSIVKIGGGSSEGVSIDANGPLLLDDRQLLVDGRQRIGVRLEILRSYNLPSEFHRVVTSVNSPASPVTAPVFRIRKSGRADEAEATTGVDIKTVMADAGLCVCEGGMVFSSGATSMR